MTLRYLACYMAAVLIVAAQEPLRVDVSVVTVGVRVTDSRGRDVRGLRVEDFSLYEDGKPEDIAFFSSETQPIALGILIDSSSSMIADQKIDRAEEAARALVAGARAGSEFFVIDFDDKVKVLSGFTANRPDVESAIGKVVAAGGTSLYDALLGGLVLTGQARLPRQAIVVISDGTDQHSTHTLQEVVDILRESQIQVYTIGYFSAAEEQLFRSSGPKLSLTNGDEVDNARLALESIAKESGAESYFPRSDEQLAKAVAEINEDLRTQYTLSFYPDSSNSEGYHKLRVAVKGGRYRVRARPGYGTREFQPGTARTAVSGAFERNVKRKAGLNVYKDDFSDPGSGWPQRSNAQYSNGGYRLAGQDVVVTNGPEFEDFQASVSFSVSNPQLPIDSLRGVGNRGLLSGTLSQLSVGAGLVFRQAGAGYYALLILPSQQSRRSYAVAIKKEDLKSTELERWPLLERRSANYTISVLCTGSQCEFREGDRALGLLKNVSNAEGHVGLALSGKGEAVFDDLIVEELQ